MQVNLLTSYFGGPYQWGCDLAKALRENGYSVNHINAFSKRFAGMFAQNADIVHTTIPFPIKMWKRPMVVTVQGDYTEEKNILQRYYPKLVEQGHALTTSSRYIKEKLSLDRAVVIPNAVFPERFKVAEHGTRKTLNLATIMNFYIKGKVKGLIDMIGIMKDSGVRDFQHIIVGDGPYRPWVEETVEKSGLDIKLSGMLNDVSLVLANSDIFLYMSYQDSFPNVIAEAMTSGLPVLTNRFASVEDIITHGKDGLIADDPYDFAMQFAELSKRVTMRRRLGEEAIGTVERNFNWHLVVLRFMEIYERINKRR